jgi:hypothetical protein
MKLPFKKPILGYIIFVLFICIFYLYFTMYFEGAQATTWIAKPIDITKDIKQYNTRLTEGDLPGKPANKNLQASCAGIDKTNKLIRTFSDGITTVNNVKICGTQKNISFDNGKTMTKLYCTMSDKSINKGFNGICNIDPSGKENKYYFVSSPALAPVPAPAPARAPAPSSKKK